MQAPQYHCLPGRLRHTREILHRNAQAATVAFPLAFLFLCDSQRVIKRSGSEKIKTLKRGRNDSFQDGKEIIQMHLDLHLTDVFLKNMCKLNHTLDSQGNLGI